MPTLDESVQHAFKLAEASEFDTLLEYMRLYGVGGVTEWLTALCTTNFIAREESFLGLCVRKEAAHKGEEWKRRSAKSGWKVIELLIEQTSPLYAQDVFWNAAKHGDVGVLEAACARNWHIGGRDVLYDPISGRGRGDMYCDILQGAGDGGNALEVFKWLAKSKDTYFFRRGDIPPHEWTGIPEDAAYANRLQNEFSSVLSSVLRNEDIDAATYIMDVPHALGYDYDCANRMSDDARRHYVTESANARSIKSLDFLCGRWGLDLVTDYVREGLEEVGVSSDGEEWIEPDFPINDDCRDEIETWLNDKVSGTAKEHLMNAMATLDENKQQLAEMEYLKIVNELHKVYKRL